MKFYNYQLRDVSFILSCQELNCDIE